MDTTHRKPSRSRPGVVAPMVVAAVAAVALLPAPAATAATTTTTTSAAETASTVARGGGRAAAPGTIVAVEAGGGMTAAQVSLSLRDSGIDASRVRYGATWYRVLYRTTDSAGAPTTASQLVVLPHTRRASLPVVSWLHGTTVHRDEVASVNPASNDRRAALLFASTGRAVSAPDYVGLGRGEGFHPYGDAAATVSAAVDGLRAARALARGTGRDLAREVQISGFSQGGPATMLVGRALQEEGRDPYFRAGALAPVSGPFELSAFEAAAADDAVDHAPLYLAYFATAWDRMYGLYDAPADAFRAPYDQRIEELFDGRHSARDLMEALPATSRELFTPAFLDRIRKPDGELARRLRVLDRTCDWRPDVPVHLFHGSGDQDVVFAHARHCVAQLERGRADYALTDVGAVDHNTSVKRALPLVVDFFDRRRP
ncbi:alpha/beta hydrolase family protein [Streptomyces kanasensis]|uniref:alpha/beta hydrolase family protein n=1 Tax=Streptomyces kanasensis TaxID=936756 RepID=UPI0037034A50